MVNLIKLEIKKILKPTIITLLFTTVLSLIALMHVSNKFYVQNSFEFWNLSIDYISIIFPILVVCPTCWVMYYERKNRFLIYTFPRVPKKDYILSKWIVCILSAFLIIFIPMLISGLVSLSLLQNVHPPKSYENAFYINLFMPDLLINNTYIYIFVHCLWDGILAMIIASIGFVFSLYLDNLFVILTGPFIYVILDNFIMAILKFPRQRLIASFYINVMTDTKITNLLVGPTIAILFILVILITFKFKKMKIYNL